jgi:hypothetical protein
MEWIKCSDRMPEDGEEVMTFGDWGRQQGTYVHNFWRLCGGDNIASPDDVTHWMPLPEAPVCTP